MQTTAATAVPMTDVSTLINSTVFLKTRFSVPGNSRKVQGDILQTDADKSLLRVSKQLLNSQELEAIKRADFQVRAYLYNLTHPFDLGVQLLSLQLVEQVDAHLNDYAITRAGLVETFLSAYPSLCETASKSLGSLHNPHDYPSVEAIREKFAFSWEIFSFSVPEQLKGMSTVLYSQAKAKLEATMKDAAAEITALMRSDLLELVNHLHEKLTPGIDGKPRILRDTAVKNVHEWVELFSARNVTNDAELAAVVSELQGMLNGVNGDKLRNSDLFRDKLRQQMDGVKSKLGGLVTEKTGRMFRD